jgi:hypothetical protein
MFLTFPCWGVTFNPTEQSIGSSGIGPLLYMGKTVSPPETTSDRYHKTVACRFLPPFSMFFSVTGSFSYLRGSIEKQSEHYSRVFHVATYKNSYRNSRGASRTFLSVRNEGPVHILGGFGGYAQVKQSYYQLPP